MTILPLVISRSSMSTARTTWLTYLWSLWTGLTSCNSMDTLAFIMQMLEHLFHVRRSNHQEELYAYMWAGDQEEQISRLSFTFIGFFFFCFLFSWFVYDITICSVLQVHWCLAIIIRRSVDTFLSHFWSWYPVLSICDTTCLYKLRSVNIHSPQSYLLSWYWGLNSS